MHFTYIHSKKQNDNYISYDIKHNMFRFTSYQIYHKRNNVYNNQ